MRRVISGVLTFRDRVVLKGKTPQVDVDSSLEQRGRAECLEDL